MTTKINSNGQVTIPAPIRKKMGLHPGSRVNIKLQEDGTIKVTLHEDISIFDIHTLHNSTVVLSDEELQEATSHAFRPSEYDDYEA